MSATVISTDYFEPLDHGGSSFRRLKDLGMIKKAEYKRTKGRPVRNGHLERQLTAGLLADST
jgi:hypothetical protein